MTHDELSTEVNRRLQVALYNGDIPALHALKAVLELHKPNIKGGCDICSWITNGFVLYEVCPTIQAIEKELS